MTQRHVVVGVDGSAGSRAALGWAIGLGQTFGAEVVAVHAVGLLEDLGAHPVAGRDRLADLRRLVEEAWCDQLRAAGGPYRIELRDGSPLDVIKAATESERAAVLVVGSRGTGGQPALALGSTSLALLQVVRVPVLVVPEGAAAPGRGGGLALRDILVGIDRSPPSLAALDLAADVAGATGATMTVLEVTGGEDGPERVGPLVDEVVADIRAGGVAVHRDVRAGDPAAVLLDQAEQTGADLVVVGTRGRGGPAAPLLGSVARTVADGARRPTLVLPAAAGAVRLAPPAAA
jgi:nucleotide-binding universal stress UspA family protein